MKTVEEIQTRFRDEQASIVHLLEQADGKGIFQKDLWERPEGGGGVTRTMAGGDAIEKAGVNFSYVHGMMSESMARALEVKGEERFAATGISSIIHPSNPFVPIIHMNIRYFELSSGRCWFGGGIDLTPHYIIPEEATIFHKALKEVCDKYNADFYPKFKAWADDYFYLHHRDETRGVGGIFFDRQEPNEQLDKDRWMSFQIDLARLYPDIYIQFLNKSRNAGFSEENKKWQELRRSRYVEFNLLYDRGTKFGLVSGGRTESILVSMPPTARWMYMYEPDSGSREAETQGLLKKNMDWINYGK